MKANCKLKYKSGSSGIHIKPENKGTFTRYAKSHGESVQGMASKVLANKDNYSTAIVKKAVFAKNATKFKHKEGTNSLKNNRQIETEGREPVFTKDGKLISYNPNEPTHKEGGVNAIVVPEDKYSDYALKLHNSTSKTKIFPEGSSIVTAEKGLNIEALNAYNKGDKVKLNKIINSMPKDGKMKYKDGVNNIRPTRGGLGYYNISPEELNARNQEDSYNAQMKYSNLNKLNNQGLAYDSQNKYSNLYNNGNDTPVNNNTNNNLQNLGSGLVSAIGSIGSVYGATTPIWRNAQLGKQKAELTKRSYLNKIQLNDNYNIQPQLNNVYNSYKNQLGFVNDRTGTIQNRRALSQSALNNKTNQTNEILAQKANYINDLNNKQVLTNSDIAARNLELKNQYETFDAMNRAKKADATSKAMEEVGAFSGDLSRHLAANRQNTYNQEMYKKYFDTLENSNDLSKYKEVGIKKKGVKNLKYKNK